MFLWPSWNASHMYSGFPYLLRVLPAWLTMRRRKRRIRMTGLLLLLLFTASLEILTLHKWPTKINASGMDLILKVFSNLNDSRILYAIKKFGVSSVILEWLLFLLKPLSCSVSHRPFEDYKGGNWHQCYFHWERRKHFCQTFFFSFLQCILRSAMLINSFLNGLLSGWETERITQFTSSFWNSSSSEYSKKKAALKFTGMHVWYADFLNSIIDFCVFTEGY